ncbi:M48 family metallopeptidase [Sphingomonas sp.]|uniref:M48 family metallopeptidase n=1 Tax=Sphingomonas sp. TaxID=28214 RepID=UPI002FCC1117
MAAGWFYDGETATRRAADVGVDGDRLIIAAEGAADLTIPASDLVHVESRPDAELYGHRTIEGWRLGLATPVAAQLAALLPPRRVYGRWIDRIGLGPALVGGLALSALVLLFGQHFPAWIAPHVPKSLERRLGNALVGDFGRKYCAGADGQRALDKLGARLGARPGELRIRVVDVPIVNAAALPGGNIMIFRELITQAHGPDEVAGVLAHEIAHVENRDVTQTMIRQFGLSLIIASVGGTTGGNVEMLMSARYGRTAEARADADAIEALRRANISPLATAHWFERMAKTERNYRLVTQSLAYLSSHPLSESRRWKFEQAAAAGGPYSAALDAEEWRALVGICGKPSPGRPS